MENAHRTDRTHAVAVQQVSKAGDIEDSVRTLKKTIDGDDVGDSLHDPIQKETGDLMAKASAKRQGVVDFVVLSHVPGKSEIIKHYHEQFPRARKTTYFVKHSRCLGVCCDAGQEQSLRPWNKYTIVSDSTSQRLQAMLEIVGKGDFVLICIGLHKINRANVAADAESF